MEHSQTEVEFERILEKVDPNRLVRKVTAISPITLYLQWLVV